MTELSLFWTSRADRLSVQPGAMVAGSPLAPVAGELYQKFSLNGSTPGSDRTLLVTCRPPEATLTSAVVHLSSGSLM